MACTPCPPGEDQEKGEVVGPYLPTSLVHDQETFWSMKKGVLSASRNDLAASLGQLVSAVQLIAQHVS